MVPALLVMALKSYLSALGRTQVVLWTTIGGGGCQLRHRLCADLWPLGRCPRLGVRGAAIASLSVQVLSPLSMLAIYAGWLPELRRFHLFQRFWRPDWQAMRPGVPAGLADRRDGAGWRRGCFRACR